MHVGRHRQYRPTIDERKPPFGHCEIVSKLQYAVYPGEMQANNQIEWRRDGNTGCIQVHSLSHKFDESMLQLEFSRPPNSRISNHSEP